MIALKGHATIAQGVALVVVHKYRELRECLEFTQTSPPFCQRRGSPGVCRGGVVKPQNCDFPMVNHPIPINRDRPSFLAFHR